MSRQTVPLLRRLLLQSSSPTHSTTTTTTTTLLSSSSRSITHVPPPTDDGAPIEVTLSPINSGIQGKKTSTSTSTSSVREEEAMMKAWIKCGGLSNVAVTPNLYGNMFVNSAGRIAGGIGQMPGGSMGTKYSTLVQGASAGDDNTLEQKRANPAASFRPLSPHLAVYQPQVNSLFSITNRISGIFLTGIGLSYYFLCLKMAPICFTHETFYQLLFYSSKLVPITVEITALALTYHVIYGVKHLWEDFGGFRFLRSGGK